MIGKVRVGREMTKLELKQMDDEAAKMHAAQKRRAVVVVKRTVAATADALGSSPGVRIVPAAVARSVESIRAVLDTKRKLEQASSKEDAFYKLFTRVVVEEDADVG